MQFAAQLIQNIVRQKKRQRNAIARQAWLKEEIERRKEQLSCHMEKRDELTKERDRVQKDAAELRRLVNHEQTRVDSLRAEIVKKQNTDSVAKVDACVAEANDAILSFKQWSLAKEMNDEITELRRIAETGSVGSP